MAIRVTHVDKSTYSGVFIKSFIWSIFFNVFFLMNTWRMQYSDPQKNKLKVYGSLLGCAVLPLILLLAIPVRLIPKQEYLLSVLVIVAVVIALTLVLIFAIRKYNSLKKQK